MTKPVTAELKRHIERKKSLESHKEFFKGLLPSIYRAERHGTLALSAAMDKLMPLFKAAAMDDAKNAYRHDLRFEAGAKYLRNLIDTSPMGEPMGIKAMGPSEWRQEAVNELTVTLKDLPESDELTIKAFNEVFYREHPTNRQSVVAVFAAACNHLVEMNKANDDVMRASTFSGAVPYI